MIFPNNHRTKKMCNCSSLLSTVHWSFRFRSSEGGRGVCEVVIMITVGLLKIWERLLLCRKNAGIFT